MLSLFTAQRKRIKYLCLMKKYRPLSKASNGSIKEFKENADMKAEVQ
jgi:hypothetical protein